MHAHSFLLLLVIGVAVNLVFFSFECSLIFDSFDRNAPTWEIVALFSIAILLLGGACLGIFLVLKLVLYLQYLPTGKFGGVSLKTPLLGCTQLCGLISLGACRAV